MMEKNDDNIHRDTYKNDEFIICKKDWELIEKRLNDLERTQDKLYDNLKKALSLINP